MDPAFAFINWTAVFWVLDGIGLIVWSFVSPARGLLPVGVAQILCVAARIFLIKENEASEILIFPLLLFLIFLVLWRHYMWQKRDKAQWEKRWGQFGNPFVWNGKISVLLVIVCAVTTVSSIALGISNGSLEHLVYACIFGSTVAVFTPPGSYGLSSCFVTRWLVRALTIFSCGFAVGLLIH